MVHISPNTRSLLQHVALRLDERTRQSLHLTHNSQAQGLHLLLPLLEAALAVDEEAQAEARGHRHRAAAASGGGRRPGPDMSLRRPALLLLASLRSSAAGTDEEQHLQWLLESLTADQRTAQAGATLQVEQGTTLYSTLGCVWARESGYRGGLFKGLHMLASVRAEEALVAWILRAEGAARKQRTEAVEILRPLINLLYQVRHLLQDKKQQEQEQQE